MRAVVRSMVEALEPVDDVEREHRADVLSWLDSGVEIIRTEKPATPPKHLVSYCAVVDADCDNALLVDHRDAQRWLPAGGHVEPGEHPVDAARREIGEELGLSPPFHRAVGEVPLLLTVTRTGGRSEPHTDVSLWYVFEASQDEAVVADQVEFAAVRWWPIDDIDHGAGGEGTRFDPHWPRFVRKLRRRAAARRG